MFIAEGGARQESGLVKANRRLGKLPSLAGRVAITSSGGGKTKRQNFIRAAFIAKKKYGGFILGDKNSNGSRTLSLITSITKTKKGVKIKRTPLYSVKNGRAVKVHQTNFMQRASHESAMQMNKFFVANAQLQFKKYLTT